MQLGEVGGERLAAEPLLEGLLEPFDLAAGLGVVGPGGLGDDTDRSELDLEVDLEAAELPGEVQAVVGELTERHTPERLLASQNVSQVASVVAWSSALTRKRDPGVVIEEAEDLHRPGGDHPVDAVGLPQLVRSGRPRTAENEHFGRLRGSGTTNPRRTRTRQIVASDGTARRP